MTHDDFLDQFQATYRWPTSPAKRRFRYQKKINNGMLEEHRLALTLGGVVDRALDDVEGLQSSDYSTYQIFETDDLAFKLIDLENIKTSRVGHVPRRGIMSPVYIRLSALKKHTYSRYYYWFFYGAYLNNIFNGMGGGVRQNLTPTDLLEFPIPIPDFPTQQAIADFLDRETARVDQLIEKKDRQYLALEEDHQAFVTMAVSTGLDAAPMSPTANTWLKEIPAHWDLSRLKFVCARIVDCLHETPEHSESGDYPSIRTADLIRGRLLLDQAKRVSEDEYRIRIERLGPAEGDVLYTREGERFGLAALVPPGVKLCLGQRMMMFRTNRRVLPAFLMWSLNGQFAYNWLKQSTSGATSPHLNIYDIRNVPLPLPPLAEQRSIVNRIDARFRRKEAAAGAIRISIERLREYRSALITAAVTGQIDVATWGKRGATDPRLDAIEADMARAAQPERQQARA